MAQRYSCRFGSGGRRRLKIRNGGHAESGDATLGKSAGGEGDVTIDGAGSLWTVTGNVNVGNTATGVLSSLVVTDGGILSASGTVTAGAMGVVGGNGSISGALMNNGLVSPGTSPGALHVNGTYSQTAAGKLKIELGGTSPGTNYDQLLVNGTASLNGTLQVSILDPYLPMKGDTYNILDWTGSLSGTFSSLQLPALYGGLGWNLSQLYLAGTLSIGGVLGDYNGNGVVDAADYTVWRNALGRTGSGLAADGNGDKAVTQADYVVWKTNFGQHAGSGSAADSPPSVAVPEPGSLQLILLSVIASWELADSTSLGGRRNQFTAIDNRLRRAAGRCGICRSLLRSSRFRLSNPFGSTHFLPLGVIRRW